MVANTASDIQPGICLLTPADLTCDLLSGLVLSALAHEGVEVVILGKTTQNCAPGGLIRDLRAAVARHGKVFLVEDNLPLALTLEAEGTLVDNIEDIARTRKAIGNEAMVGVRCGLSRHKAMEAGESGADFVALHATSDTPEGSDELDRHITWWSQLFEIPSVAFGAHNVTEAQAQMDAGADFVALGNPFWGKGRLAAALDKLLIETSRERTGPE